ncbi:MAG TPA: phage protease [Verrucomicrobiae bacterium]|nr:phage protease [Verrucomicrobiae bacterium]
MNPIILNRDFQHPADGWYMIEPKGEHPNTRRGIIQVIDDQACQEIVNRFNAEADKPGFPGLLIDHEHFKHYANQETRAYGWLMRLQNRADGIYGQVKWTATGRAAVDGGDYRFFSTEYDPADVVVLNRGQKPERGRPLKLDGLSLTNDPNNKGSQPITNRQEDFRRDAAADGTNNQRKTMKSVATKLGLSADASEEAVLAEVTKIMNRATEAETKVTGLSTRVTTLETHNNTLLGEQIDADLATHGVKDEKIINRVRPFLVGMKNREERVTFLTEVLGAKAEDTAAATTAAATTRQVLNRADAKAPAAKGGDAQANEREKTQKITNRAQELKGAAPSRSWDSCWNQAVTENSK